MNNETIAVILGGGAGTRLFPLTRDRSKPAVPLAGKYRLIDIPVSNCINSSIDRIFVLTQFNSASLNRHIAQTYRLDVFSQEKLEPRLAPRVSATWVVSQDAVITVAAVLVFSRALEATGIVGALARFVSSDRPSIAAGMIAFLFYGGMLLTVAGVWLWRRRLSRTWYGVFLGGGLGGSRSVQLRLDLFNAFNQAAITGRNTTINFVRPTYGTIRILPFDDAGNVIDSSIAGSVRRTASSICRQVTGSATTMTEAPASGTRPNPVSLPV